MERLQQNLVTARPEPRPESAPPRQARQPASGAPVIDVHGLSVWYDDFEAVTDVSLSVLEREITAFIGSSGSGKTTVLRALNRLSDLIPSARVGGDVEYRGENLYGPDVSPVAVRRRIGMVFQKPNPFPKSIYGRPLDDPRPDQVEPGEQAASAVR
jgi:phosphate transport system ATP-binding protein